MLSEVIKQHDLWAYPYNALRNQAVSRAETQVHPSLRNIAVCARPQGRVSLSSWAKWLLPCTTGPLQQVHAPTHVPHLWLVLNTVCPTTLTAPHDSARCLPHLFPQ